MCKRIILLFPIIFLIQISFAEEWYKATVTLRSQRTLQGSIAVRPDYEVILFKQGDEVMVYPAHKIESFYFFDEDTNQLRKFISLQCISGAATSHRFFEIMIDGELSVLRRQHLVWYSIHLDVMDYDYYLRKDDQIITLRKFRSKIYPSLANSYEGKLKTYVRENKLSLNRFSDVMRIIEAFNQFATAENAMAKN